MFSVDDARNFCKQNEIKGLEIRSQNSVRAVIRHAGKVYRIKLDNVVTDKKSLLLAAVKIEELKQLAKYNFDLFINTVGNTSSKKMIHYIDEFLATKEQKLAFATLRSYKSKIKTYISPKFSDMSASEVTPKLIENWINRELTHLSNKSKKELISIFNQVCVLALLDGVIKDNPFDYLRAGKLISMKTVTHEPEPFTLDEINTLVTRCSNNNSDINLFHFNCFTGLRLSEVMALAWEDVNWIDGTIAIERAVVLKGYKTPKTVSSNRKIQLLPQALDVLKKQHRLTGENPPQKINLTLEDNKTIINKNLSFIFINSRTNKGYNHDNDYRDVFFKKHLARCGVKYRGPNQMRHTFASHLISAGVPLTWVASQMGHNSIKMLEKHYSKWLPTRSGQIASLAATAFI